MSDLETVRGRPGDRARPARRDLTVVIQPRPATLAANEEAPPGHWRGQRATPPAVVPSRSPLHTAKGVHNQPAVGPAGPVRGRAANEQPRSRAAQRRPRNRSREGRPHSYESEALPEHPTQRFPECVDHPILVGVEDQRNRLNLQNQKRILVELRELGNERQQSEERCGVAWQDRQFGLEPLDATDEFFYPWTKQSQFRSQARQVGRNCWSLDVCPSTIYRAVSQRDQALESRQQKASLRFA
jgi:hypothetical protein